MGGEERLEGSGVMQIPRLGWEGGQNRGPARRPPGKATSWQSRREKPQALWPGKRREGFTEEQRINYHFHRTVTLQVGGF